MLGLRILRGRRKQGFRNSDGTRITLKPRLARWAGVGVFILAAAVLSCEDEIREPYGGPWKVVRCPELPNLHYFTGVHFVKANLGYCVGGPYILKWDGVSWKKDYELIPTPPHDMATCYDVYFLNENDGWVAGGEGTASEGKLVILHWDGKKWDRVLQSLPMDYVYCIFFLDENHGWIGGDGIAKWDGSNWTYETAIYAVEDIFINSPTDGWAVSKSSERIYHYDGLTWTRVHDDPWGIELYGIWFTSPDQGWAAGDGCISGTQSNLLEYKKGSWQYYLGNPWVEGIRQSIYGLHFADADNGWAVGQMTFRWDGERWSFVKRPPPETHTGTMFDVFTLDENDAWAVGDARTILHYEP